MLGKNESIVVCTQINTSVWSQQPEYLLSSCQFSVCFLYNCRPPQSRGRKMSWQKRQCFMMLFDIGQVAAKVGSPFHHQGLKIVQCICVYTETDVFSRFGIIWSFASVHSCASYIAKTSNHGVTHLPNLFRDNQGGNTSRIRAIK